MAIRAKWFSCFAQIGLFFCTKRSALSVKSLLLVRAVAKRGGNYKSQLFWWNDSRERVPRETPRQKDIVVHRPHWQQRVTCGGTTPSSLSLFLVPRCSLSVSQLISPLSLSCFGFLSFVLSLSLSQFPRFSPSFSLSPFLSVSSSFSLSLSLYLHQNSSLYLSLCVSLSLYPSLCVSLCLSVSLCPTLSLKKMISISLCPCFSSYRRFSVILSLCLVLLSLWNKLSLPPSLQFSQSFSHCSWFPFRVSQALAISCNQIFSFPPWSCLLSVVALDVGKDARCLFLCTWCQIWALFPSQFRHPKCRCRWYLGAVKIAPSPPFKFLDIGTKMGLHEVEGLTPCSDQFNVHNPRSSQRILAPNAFYEAVHWGLLKQQTGDSPWCDEKAWTEHSTLSDFRVSEPLGFLWGLPILIPTCPRKLFEQGPRLK